MRTPVLGAVLVVGLLCSSRAQASDCTKGGLDTVIRNDIWESGPLTATEEAYTRRSNSWWYTCGGQLRVNAFIVNYGPGQNQWGYVDATIRWNQSVQPGSVHSVSQHWFNWGGPSEYRFTPDLNDYETIHQVNGGGGTCDPTGTNEMNCIADGGTWDPYGCSCSYSPIVILLTPGARYDLTSVRDGVMFDYRGDGVREHTAWTVPGESEGLLALDRNGNGQIDSGEELFGDFTRLRNGERADNGFQALADLDPEASLDGMIDRGDSVYQSLRLWVDQNHNGISEPEELLTLPQAGIEAISLAYSKSGRRDENGNVLSYEGHIVVKISTAEVMKKIYDVFFAIAQ